MVVTHPPPSIRYNSNTKRVEGSLKGAFDREMETDYIVVASTHIDPKVDAARDSGLEIDQVSVCSGGRGIALIANVCRARGVLFECTRWTKTSLVRI